MSKITKWYVINTKPKYENLVHKILELKSLKVFLPTIVGRNIQPLFPGYIFVQVDLDQPEHAVIKYTPGVKKIVSYGTRPIPVSETILEEIKARLNKSNFVQKNLIPFKTGDKVQFTSGPFEGFEGIFTGSVSGKQRVKILIELLKQSFRVETEISYLRK